MKKPKESEHCCSGTDRISQLPDNVIDKILTSMTIVDAATTSILSRKWYRAWKNVSTLVFDSSFGDKFVIGGRLCLMLGIYQTLFLHLGTIDRFTLSIPWLEGCAEINPLLQCLSGKKVKHIKMHLMCEDLHLLPLYLFSCFQLITLDLDGFVFRPPHSFGGFSQLMTLVLKAVVIINDFGIFISKCPLLQQLKLLDCTFEEVSSINIIAPNLQTFLYEGREFFICFVSAPRLDQLEFFEPDYNCKGSSKPLNFDRLKKSHLEKFSSALPTLRKLNIGHSFFKILDVKDLSGDPGHPPNCLQQLKELHLNYICFANLEYVSTLTGLIRSSPNLEQFSAKIHKCDCVRHAPVSLLNIFGPDQYDLSYNKLQTVDLFGFDGTDPEMEFAKFLLLKLSQLKMMTIHQASKDDQKGMQILRKIVRFQRASAVVDINYCDPETAQG